MSKATNSVFARAEQDGISLRDPAFDVSVQRVAHAAEVRGYI